MAKTDGKNQDNLTSPSLPPKRHTSGREGFEDSEQNYYDGILPPNQADRMICLAEEGQELLPLEHRVSDEELEADFLSLVNNGATGSAQGQDR